MTKLHIALLGHRYAGKTLLASHLVANHGYQVFQLTRPVVGAPGDMQVAMEQGVPVVLDAITYPNEYTWAKSHGFLFVSIWRPRWHRRWIDDDASVFPGDEDDLPPFYTASIEIANIGRKEQSGRELDVRLAQWARRSET